jgi:sigma-B regulation protein RsbU (phosphoserine phosphatase)
LILLPSGEVTVLEHAGGPPVGLLSHLTYRREIGTVEPGSAIVIYTDGVSEAENLIEEQFGMERFKALLGKQNGKTAADIHAQIRRSIAEFVGEQSTHDDSTLVVLKFPR